MNEPAFPQGGAKWDYGKHRYELHPVEGGMSLRDYFAAKALQGFCVGAQNMGSLSAEEVGRQFLELGRFTYLVADAMLKARQS